MDYGAGGKIGVQAKRLQDLFFILDLEPRLLQGGKCPTLAASERGEHSARQKDRHTSWLASLPSEPSRPPAEADAVNQVCNGPLPSRERRPLAV